MSNSCPVKGVNFPSSSSSLSSSSNSNDNKVVSIDNKLSNEFKCSYNEAVNDIVFDQEKQLHQKVELGKERRVSSIPKSDYTPSHQPSNQTRWIYPSGI
jgi:hypothetical protein